MIILGLDMSSTAIGYAVLSDGAIFDYGHEDLRGDIAARCAQAATRVAELLDEHGPTLVVIESPVARHAKAVIPQARVSGAVLGVLSSRLALWQEVPPGVAKRVLAGCGTASKAQMLEAARCRLELVGDAYAYRGKWGLWHGGVCVLSEDEADAIGVALAGAALRVVVMEAA